MHVSHQNDALHRDLLSSLRYERSPDTANKLRFVVITGIDRDHPAWYRLLIAPNEEAMEARPGDHFVLVTRIHTMNAETPENLLRFLSKYEHAKAFILTPGRLEATDNEPLFHPELGILSRNLIVRPAWEINENDPDGVGIFVDDNLIVPEGIQDAPALRTLARKKQRNPKDPT